ncbi:MAG TPA: peptidoglycan DD-metalloendopeptidase family protein [Solirubrobacterales bacterium]|nr:peptidoglycan DD-metalloendopeptidase family protein [Solirubrobacterales bacterium]
MAGVSFTFAAIALLLCLAASAAASTGGAPTAAGAPAASGSPTGTPAGEAPSAGVLSLVSAQTAPRKSFFYGFRYPNVRFSIASTQQQNDLQIDVVNSAGEVARSFYRNDVEPNVEVRIRWDGTTSEGRPARNGRYSFRIQPQGGSEVAARATTSSEPLSLGFALYGYAFPILGAHEFGGSAGRFGAGRSGHTHQGQDTMAACGTPLVAARGGTVQYAGYQYAAGNYVVIDGKGTTLDFMYAHLAEPSPLRTGETVRTGQPIGIVGDTGDASACHLHFEIWGAPGWYEGGSPFDPLPYLEQWDAYS